ncbi:MAG: sigma-E factor negative regulatory protein RseB, partial [Candidatus Azotimanducaceae bacterium]
SDRVLASRNLYRLSVHGEDRVAGRMAVKVSISPRNNDRYGYRLWLDQKTGLLLQSHLIDRGKVKELFQFTNLTIGEDIPVEYLASAIIGETVSHALAFDMGERTEKPVLRVNWLPDGFRAVRSRGNRLHFSDGLATFSVFIEKPGSVGLPDMVTTRGGTVVITRRLNGSGPQITVVGEVPVQTARRVADSVEPVIY